MSVLGFKHLTNWVSLSQESLHVIFIPQKLVLRLDSNLGPLDFESCLHVLYQDICLREKNENNSSNSYWSRFRSFLTALGNCAPLFSLWSKQGMNSATQTIANSKKIIPYWCEELFAFPQNYVPFDGRKQFFALVQSYNVKQVGKELNRNCFRTKIASGSFDRQFDVSVTGFQIHCRAHYVWRQEMSEGMIEPQSLGVFISVIDINKYKIKSK